MEIATNIFSLDCVQHGHVFYLKAEHTLIDTGLPGKGKLILQELSRIGIEGLDIKRILLTHYDVDHAGNVQFLEEKTKAEVFIGWDDLPYLMNEVPRQGIKNIIQKIMRVAPPKHCKTFEAPGDFYNIQIFHTPGHTPGHHIFLYQNILFAGDLFKINGDCLQAMNPRMNYNETLLRNSILSLKDIPFSLVCPGHGNPLTKEKITPLIEQLWE